MNVHSLNVASIHFHEPNFGSKGQKMVDVSFDPESKSWSNKVIFQVCKDENDPLRSPYGISKPLPNASQEDKQNLDLILEDKDAIEKLKELDEHVKNYALKNSKSLFRKELTNEVIQDKYKGVLKYKEASEKNDAYHYISVKVNKSKEKPTPICLINNGTLTKGSIDDLIGGCKVVPVVRVLFVWFMSDTFGISANADKLLVYPTRKREFLDDFILSKKFEVA